jgi:hypothetical protein
MAISGAGVNAVPSMRVHKESRIDGYGASRSGGLKTAVYVVGDCKSPLLEGWLGGGPWSLSQG